MPISNSFKESTGHAHRCRELDDSKPSFRFTFPATRWWVVLLILLAEASERLSFYVMSGTYKKVMTSFFNFDVASASSMYTAFTMLGFLSPVLFGVLADSYLGNYWSSLIAFALYLLGKLMVAVSLAPDDLNYALWTTGTFIFMSLGIGMKATLIAFGADQLQQQEEDSEDDFQQRRSSFFHWYYASIGVCSILTTHILSRARRAF